MRVYCKYYVYCNEGALFCNVYMLGFYLENNRIKMNEMELLTGKSDHKLKVKIRKLFIILSVISITATFIFVTRVSDNDIIDVSPESMKVVHNGGITIYAITPTYARPVQKAELTRLSHTFKLVPNLHWIVVEDASASTRLVSNLLKNSGLPYTHLIQATPASWKLANNEGRWKKPRGVLQRNTALKWIRQNFSKEDLGVIYFADDDNTYSLELFEEMRNTKKVSIWPVGLVGGLLVEKPIVENGKVVGFNAGWRPERKFPIDMAGFAISLKHFLSNPNAKFSYNSEGGFQETDFLSLLTTREELEPMAANCTKILVWHTRSEKPILVYENQLRKKGLKPSNYGMEE